MKEVVITFPNRARKYGYITWKSKYDESINSLLDGATKIELVLNAKSVGLKNVDWKRRRIGITYTFTRAVPKEFTKIRLKTDTKKRLYAEFF